MGGWRSRAAPLPAENQKPDESQHRPEEDSAHKGAGQHPAQLLAKPREQACQQHHKDNSDRYENDKAHHVVGLRISATPTRLGRQLIDTILPGFMIFCGSIACFMVAITA